MAIGNVTPDSFYAASRLGSTDAVVAWAQQALADGAEILDIGACSTRPGSTPASEEEEWRRLEPALAALREALPEVRLSVDTFRPEIALRQARVPYIWTLRGDLDLPARMPELRNIDLILDPGFGFIGSTEADYECMRNMHRLRAYNLPILVGVSRKSMVWRPLGLTPETCLEATQALQLYALEQGATILRTHDVAATRQTIEIFNLLCNF